MTFYIASCWSIISVIMASRFLFFMVLLTSVQTYAAEEVSRVRSPDPAQIGAAGSGKWFGDRDRGWHFYEPDPEPEEEVVEVVPEVAPPEVVPPAAEAKPEPAPPAGPAPFSVKWIRDNIDRIRDTAIDDPSPENVSAFLYAQRVMLDKAETFSGVMRKVSTEDPVINENVRQPGSTFGYHAANDFAREGKGAALNKLKKTVGVWFFFDSTCRYCAVQAPVIEELKNDYGFSVMAISRDGAPLPNGYFKNFVTDAGQAARLGIEVTPAIVIVRPPDQMAVVGQGLMARDELLDRIIEVAGENKWLSDDEFQDTKTSKPVLTPPSIMQEAASNPEVVNDPKKLAEFIRSRLKSQR